MATVREPAADARLAPHAVPPLSPETAFASTPSLRGWLGRLRATVAAAPPVDAGPAVVEQAAVGAPAAVPIAGARGGRHHQAQKGTAALDAPRGPPTSCSRG